MKKTEKDIPIYKKIQNYIMDCIRDGRLQQGMVISSEDQFCTQFQTSRMTVRKAIDELVTNGILFRIKGKGTFVNRSNYEKTMNISSGWKETMKAQGYTTKTKVLNFSYEEASAKVAENLKVAVGSKVVLLERLRYADEHPVLIEKAYLNASILEGILDYEFNDESLYRVFYEQFGIELNHVYQKVYTQVIHDDYADILFHKKEATALIMENTSFDKYTRPIEFTICYINGEKYTLRYSVNK
ncbi:MULTISPECIES: GntR family transcriptional regulator [unclassified Breznakia]|uniref:GntR family transcriptional regulator n=1 Tax=unclassified Breznakia TaxID=2623764 RepID=UPI002406CAE4|nr:MULTISPECIES: GntR family transcriptional regulator [unclassified Breznakia]